MANYKSLFTRHMDSEGIKYTDVNEYAVRVGYNAKNMSSVSIYVFFDKDNEPLVTLKCWEIAKFDGEKRAAGILACNDVNNRYRWTNFYIDDDGDVNAQIDTYVDERNCGTLCTNLVGRMVSIIDGAYPTFMQALWSK